MFSSCFVLVLLWGCYPPISGREQRFIFPDDKIVIPPPESFFVANLPPRQTKNSDAPPSESVTILKESTLEQELKIVSMDNTSFCRSGEDDADFCEDPETYPDNLVEKIIQRLSRGKDATKNEFFEKGNDEDQAEVQRTIEEVNIVLPFFDTQPRLPRPQGKIEASVPLGGAPANADGVRIALDESHNRPQKEHQEGHMGRQGQVQENPSGSILTRRPQKVVPGGQTATPYTPPVGSSPPRTSQSRPFGVSQPPSIGKADAVEEEMVVDEEEEEEEVAEHVEDLYDTQKRFEEESPLCSSVASYIYPKRAQNKDNHFKFIINVPEKSFVQAVRIERCRAPGDQCSLQGGISFADLGIQTVCRQKYIHRRMLALNEQGEEEVDLFKFPSCCVCHQIELTPFRSGSAPFHSSRRNGRSEDDFDGNFGQSTDITELNEFARTD